METTILSRTFLLGPIVITREAQMTLHPYDVQLALQRYQNGDWGDIPPEIAAANQRALRESGPLTSAYQDRTRTKFEIVTEAGPARTTIRLGVEPEPPPFSEATWDDDLCQQAGTEVPGSSFPWHDSLLESPHFNLGALLVSHLVLERLSLEEISYCIDAHRRCQSDGVGWDEHCQFVAGQGGSVPSVFFVTELTPRKCAPKSSVLFVLTNRRRTRTVVRFREETSFARRLRARAGQANVPQDPTEEWARDYFWRT